MNQNEWHKRVWMCVCVYNVQCTCMLECQIETQNRRESHWKKVDTERKENWKIKKNIDEGSVTKLLTQSWHPQKNETDLACNGWHRILMGTSINNDWHNWMELCQKYGHKCAECLCKSVSVDPFESKSLELFWEGDFWVVELVNLLSIFSYYYDWKRKREILLLLFAQMMPPWMDFIWLNRKTRFSSQSISNWNSSLFQNLFNWVSVYYIKTSINQLECHNVWPFSGSNQMRNTNR